MTFKFRYESLLNYRRHLKDMAQIELARSMEQLQSARDALNLAAAEYTKVADAFGQGLRKGMVAHKLRSYSSYLGKLKEDITQKAVQVAEWEEIVEKKRSALLDRDKEWKIIEKLKERDFQKWLSEKETKEQMALNEMAILRHGRQYR